MLATHGRQDGGGGGTKDEFYLTKAEFTKT